MSQRLAVGSPPDFQNFPASKYYDCIVTELSEDTLDKLRKGWFCMMGDGWFLGPYKIMVFDVELFKSIEPTLVKLFKSVNKAYPQDVWIIYRYVNEAVYNSIEHPSREELQNLLGADEQENY